MNAAETLRALYDAEVNFSITTFWDPGSRRSWATR
jgi:hypothetical protein